MSGTPDTQLVELLDGMRQRFALIDRQMVGLLADIDDYTRRAPQTPPMPAAPPRPAQPVQQVPQRPAAPQQRPAASRQRPVQPPRRPGWIEQQTESVGAAARRYRGELALSDFLGLRALAWAGGLITLLGIIFFYVLANQNGWVGPGSRVLLGTAVSAGLLGLAVWLHGQKDQPEGALACAGTGIAGLYVTLFAATTLYGYVSSAAGVLLAMGIAGIAVAFALAWSRESMALLGLVGAGLAPPLAQGHISTAGVAFAVIVAAAAMVLYVEQGWRSVAGAVSAATLPQLIVLLAREQGPAPAIGWNHHYQTVALAGGFWAIYLLTGFARYLRSGKLDSTTLSILASTSTSALLVAALMFEHQERGVAMLFIAAVYGGLAFAPAAIGRPNRDLASLMGATALTAALAATGELLGGGGRAVAVSAEAALLTWVAARFRETRFQLAALAYLTAALALTLKQAPIVNLLRFPPHHMVQAGGLDTSAMLAGVLAATGFAVATCIFAFVSRPMGTDRRTWHRIVGAVAVAASLYAAAQAILGGFIWLHFTARSFQNGHTAVSLVVALVGVGLLLVGLRRHSGDLRTGGLILLGAAVAKLFLYDLVVLNLMARAVAFIAVGLLLLAGGIVYQKLWEEDRREQPVAPG